MYLGLKISFCTTELDGSLLADIVIARIIIGRSKGLLNLS